MNRAALLLPAALFLVACPKAVPEARVEPAPDRVATPPAEAPGLKFLVEPASAEVFVDGVSRGTVAELASSGGLLALKPGIYQVSLKAKGCATWRAEVAVRERPELIQVALAKSP